MRYHNDTLCYNSPDLNLAVTKMTGDDVYMSLDDVTASVPGTVPQNETTSYYVVFYTTDLNPLSYSDNISTM